MDDGGLNDHQIGLPFPCFGTLKGSALEFNQFLGNGGNFELTAIKFLTLSE